MHFMKLLAMFTLRVGNTSFAAHPTNMASPRFSGEAHAEVYPCSMERPSQAHPTDLGRSRQEVRGRAEVGMPTSGGQCRGRRSRLRPELAPLRWEDQFSVGYDANGDAPVEMRIVSSEVVGADRNTGGTPAPSSLLLDVPRKIMEDSRFSTRKTAKQLGVRHRTVW
jgi:hypothetical protein